MLEIYFDTNVRKIARLYDRMQVFVRICYHKLVRVDTTRSTTNYKIINYRFLRYCVGVLPVCFLKALLKDDFEL